MRSRQQVTAHGHAAVISSSPVLAVTAHLAARAHLSPGCLSIQRLGLQASLPLDCSKGLSLMHAPLLSLYYLRNGMGPFCLPTYPIPSLNLLWLLTIDSCTDLCLHPLRRIMLPPRLLRVNLALPAGRCADSCPDLAQRAPCRLALPCPLPPTSRQMRSTCPSRRRASTVRFLLTAAQNLAPMAGAQSVLLLMQYSLSCTPLLLTTLLAP